MRDIQTLRGKIVRQRAGHAHGYNFSNWGLSLDEHKSIDLGRIAVRPADRNAVVVSFHQHTQALAHQFLVARHGNVLLEKHQSLQAFLFQLIRYRIA